MSVNKKLTVPDGSELLDVAGAVPTAALVLP
jgi:hypothetical protein